MVEPEERLRQSQALFRTANERLRERAQKLAGAVETIPFLCECADEACLGRIELTMAQYQEVRRVPSRYVVLPEHAAIARDHVVEDGGHFQVVEKKE
jgi:hypothetical protein